MSRLKNFNLMIYYKFRTLDVNNFRFLVCKPLSCTVSPVSACAKQEPKKTSKGSRKIQQTFIQMAKYLTRLN